MGVHDSSDFGGPSRATDSRPGVVSAPPSPPPPPLQPALRGQVPVLIGPPAPAAEPRVLGWRFWPAVVLGAVALDLALRRPPWNNVATTIGVIGFVAALLLSGRVVARSSRLGLGLAAALSFFLWFRTNPTLVVFDLLAVVGLVLWSVLHSRGTSMWDTGPLRLLVRTGESIVLALQTIDESAGELAARHRRARASGVLASAGVAGAARGAIIAIPILLVLGVLLASADAVFASFFSFDLGLDVPSLLGHAVLLAIGAFTILVMLRLASRDLSSAGEDSTIFQLGRIESMMILVGLNLLFALFAVAQVVALVGGADRVLTDAGVTLKRYAREGFFQLLWVAAITLVVLLSVHAVTKHLGRERRPILWASMVSIALTMVIVVSAVRRLFFYIEDTGLTPLRFYSSVFSVWIAVIFVVLAFRLAGVGRDRRWFTSAVGLTAVVFLLGLNVVNPEGVIVDTNLRRNDLQVVYHMEKLSADGEIVLLNGLDRLSPELQTEVVSEFCRDWGRRSRLIDDQEADDSLAFNLNTWRLEERAADVCG